MQEAKADPQNGQAPAGRSPQQPVVRLRVRNCEDCKHFGWDFEGEGPSTEYAAWCNKDHKLPHWRKPTSPLAEEYGYRCRCADWQVNPKQDLLGESTT